MKVLQLTAHFKPNIGGVETHLDDLVNVLTKNSFNVIVLAYKPLTTKVSSKFYEKKENLKIIRIPWFKGLFYKLIPYPFLEFLYLLPGLFLLTPFALVFENPSVIHAHGLVAGFVAVFWGRIFRKKVIISTHSIYSFPKEGLYHDFVKFIFTNADYCLGLSKQAVSEIVVLGINKSKVNFFTYWIDLKKFNRVSDSRKKLKWNNAFTVLFVGRLISEKGINELLESVKTWDKKINLKIIGSGPLENKVREFVKDFENVEFIQGIDSNDLPIYYSGSDLLIVPSISEEGFGRVILESLACSTAVIGANRGAIPEALDETVGKIIDITPENIKKTIEFYYQHQDRLKKLEKNCRQFVERRYSEENAQEIINTYYK